MRQYVTLFIVLTLQISVAWPSTVLANTAEATALCNPMFGGETSAILTSFNAQKLDPTEACKAYAFLLERNGTGTRGTGSGCYRSQKDRIIKLNPGFAVGLYRSLTEIEKLYGGKNIIQSGYRCDGTGGNHTRGCAADIIWTTCQRNSMGFADPWRCSSDNYNKSSNSWGTPEQKWIDANGKSERYKIHLRLRYAPEGHHVEPTSTQGCATGATVTSPSSGAPTSGIADAIRQIFSPQSAQPAQPALPQQQLEKSQSPLSSFDTSMQKPTVSDSLIQTVDPRIPKTPATIGDKLEELVFGARATTTQGATSVPIVINANDITGITSTQYQQPTTETVQANGAVSQNTFVSRDLNTNPIGSASQSATARILMQLKTTLLSLLQYLKPFHRNYDEMEHEDF